MNGDFPSFCVCLPAWPLNAVRTRSMADPPNYDKLVVATTNPVGMPGVTIPIR